MQFLSISRAVVYTERAATVLATVYSYFKNLNSLAFPMPQAAACMNCIILVCLCTFILQLNMISCSSMQTYLEEARSFHLAPVERNKAIRLLWLIVSGHTHIVIAVGLLQELLLVRFPFGPSPFITGQRYIMRVSRMKENINACYSRYL